MPIDPTDLAKSIGALGSLDPERGPDSTLKAAQTPSPTRTWVNSCQSGSSGPISREQLLGRVGDLLQGWSWTVG
jgi:hypothetical protein